MKPQLTKKTKRPQLTKKGKPPRLPIPAVSDARSRVPSMWQRRLAGVELMRPKGEGEAALDTLCRENEWTWGIVQTYQRKGLSGNPSTSTAVLIGVVVEGSAENIENSNDEAGAWRVVDQALGQVAEKLGG